MLKGLFTLLTALIATTFFANSAIANPSNLFSKVENVKSKQNEKKNNKDKKKNQDKKKAPKKKNKK